MARGSAAMQNGKCTMPDIVDLLIPFLMACVVAVLALGLWNMMRGGSANRSQSLMRMRILFQFLAVAAAIVIIYFAAGD
jgi:uncharacterized membrane protein YidH (DUF202 family)